MFLVTRRLRVGSADRAVRPGGVPPRLLVLLPALLLAALGAAVLPAPPAALAAPATATQDLTVFAGPGEGYDVLAYAPTGASLSVDGEAVDGFYPVTYEDVSGWAAAWAVAVEGGEAAAVAAPVEEQMAAPVEEERAASGATGEDAIVEIIYEAADRYGQPRDDMLRVARCESNLDPNAVNGPGGTYGLFQFLPDTFASTPYAGYDIFDPWANANAAGWMWSEGRRGEWVCQ